MWILQFYFLVPLIFISTEAYEDGNDCVKVDDFVGEGFPHFCREFVQYTKRKYANKNNYLEKFFAYSEKAGCSNLLNVLCLMKYPHCYSTNHTVCLESCYFVEDNCLKQFSVLSNDFPNFCQGLQSIVKSQNCDHAGVSKENIMKSRRDRFKLCADSRYNIFRNRCLAKCDSEILFTRDDQELAFIWTTAWATACFVATGLALTGFILQPLRFRYPERPVGWIAAAGLLHSAAYLLKTTVSSDLLRCSEGYVISKEDDGPVLCAALFALSYIGQIAVHTWWTLLGFCWLLAARLQWSPEALESTAVWLHATGWTTPAIGAVAALVFRRFSSNPLTHMCSVGSKNQWDSLMFTIAPISCFGLLGLLCTSLGCMGLYTIRGRLAQPNDARRLQLLMMRVGYFAAAYALPTSLYLACSVYELVYFEKWQKQALECTPPCELHLSIPRTDILLLKECFSFLPAFTPLLWICNRKTCITYFRCYSRPTVKHSHDQIDPIPLQMIEKPNKDNRFLNTDSGICIEATGNAHS
uniref:Frizzled-1 n=1 Tax=Hofstenia miamia TaxID=442651 RepID=A0A068CJX4_HOFMI|nr:frizzled-1 [Hofstenia miamia]